jgi:ABC-2 type transport system permease protein
VLGYGVVLVLVLLVAWFAFVGYELRPTRRLPRPQRTRVPGLFANFPASPSGAVAARSLTYWMRDPRYLAVFAIVPLVPLLMLLVFWVGGVPFSIAVLVPLPVMVLLLAWSTLHNDIAYDNTAIWQHVAAHTRGSDDRRGRAVPVVIWGVLLLLIGIPLTVWGYGDLSVAAPLTGVCVALLLGGIGVGNAYSARYPYAAPRPGDAAWQSPQVAGSQGGVAQAMSVLLTVVVAVPAFLASAVWWVEGGWWGWLALGLGLLSGVLAFVGGVRGGGAVFDRRAPELLAFTQRN